MTAKEIQDHHSFMPEMWMKEIAYQLAVMNERQQEVLDKAASALKTAKPYPHTSACDATGCHCE